MDTSRKEGKRVQLIIEDCDCCNGKGLLPDIEGNESSCFNCNGSGKLKYNRPNKAEVDRLERLKLETVAYYLNDNRDGKKVQLDFEVAMIAIEHDLWLAQGGSEN